MGGGNSYGREELKYTNNEQIMEERLQLCIHCIILKMKFDWTFKKAESNYKKHQVRFEEAQTVFLDARSIEFYDDDNSDSEDRFIRIGMSAKLRVLLVVYCEQKENLIRIISARKATPSERRDYEETI